MSDDTADLTYQQRATLAAVGEAMSRLIAEAAGDQRTALTKLLLAKFAADDSKSFVVRVPGIDRPVADITLPEKKEATKITNPAAFALWVAENYPDAGHYEFVVNPSWAKVFISKEVALADESGAVVDTKTGTVVDGVKNTPAGAPTGYSLRFRDEKATARTPAFDGKQALIDLLLASGFAGAIESASQLALTQVTPEDDDTDDDASTATVEGTVIDKDAAA